MNFGDNSQKDLERERERERGSVKTHSSYKIFCEKDGPHMDQNFIFIFYGT